MVQVLAAGWLITTEMTDGEVCPSGAEMFVPAFNNAPPSQKLSAPQLAKNVLAKPFELVAEMAAMKVVFTDETLLAANPVIFIMEFLKRNAGLLLIPVIAKLGRAFGKYCVSSMATILTV